MYICVQCSNDCVFENRSENYIYTFTKHSRLGDKKMKSRLLTKKAINVSVDIDLLSAYDVACGLASRSAMMNEALRMVAIERGYVTKEGVKIEPKIKA